MVKVAIATAKVAQNDSKWGFIASMKWEPRPNTITEKVVTTARKHTFRLFHVVEESRVDIPNSTSWTVAMENAIGLRFAQGKDSSGGGGGWQNLPFFNCGPRAHIGIC